MTINIRDRLSRARLLNQAEYKTREAEKRGVLRAGSSGIMSETGDIAGKCARLSHLRTLGIQDTPDEQKQMMFELGFASEDITCDLLYKTLEEGEVLLREEEIPIEWMTSNVTKVTGRPDIVIGTVKDPTILTAVAALLVKGTALVTGLFGANLPTSLIEPAIRRLLGPIVAYLYKDKIALQIALELKSVHSMWTARNVLFGAKDKDTGQTWQPGPQMDNVIQTAHYMWKLNVPYKLIYKAYSQLGQSADNWASAVINLPKPGEPGSEYVDYTPYGKYKGMKQFEIAYDLRIGAGDRVEYRLEADIGKPENTWTRSIVTIPDIERYFEYTSQLADKAKSLPLDKQLGPRPMTIDAQGEKLNYKTCDFCPFQKTCDEYEDKGYERWLHEVRNKMDSLSK